VPLKVKKVDYDVDLVDGLIVELDIGYTPRVTVIEVYVKATDVIDVYVEGSAAKDKWHVADVAEGVTEFHAGYINVTPYVRLRVPPASGVKCDYLICVGTLS